MPSLLEGRWGDFAAAIACWEAILGREAPAPLEGKRLSARFVEFLMGAEDGWVTDTANVSHSAALRCLGNGVVPQQAEMAYRLLLDRIEVTA